MRAHVIAVSSLIAACARGGATPTATPPRPIDPRIAACRQPDLRARATCLGQLETPDALDALLEVGRRILATPDADAGKRADFAFVAEVAGMVAAKTAATPLEADVTRGDTTAQRFGLHALTSALATLRMGYANGGERDRRARVESLAPIGDLCAERLGSPDELVIVEALHCIEETRDARHAPVVVTAILHHDHESTDDVIRAGLEALDHLAHVDAATVRPLVRLIGEPIADDAHDVAGVRGIACELLAGVVAPTDSWAVLPAQTAAERIGDRDTDARDACLKLAAEAGGPPVELPPPSLAPEACRSGHYGILGTLALCVAGDAGDPTLQTYRLALKDRSHVDAAGQPATIAATTVSVAAGEQIPVDFVTAEELDGRFWLVALPVLVGQAARYTSEHAQLYVLDTKTATFTFALATLACHHDNCSQDVHVTRPAKATSSPSILVEIRGESPQQLVWDGHALRSR